jgi:aminomethyltransferase
VSSLVSRTGYTGEDGFEIFLDAGRGEVVFEALLEAGKNDGLVPCGLGARDTLRMEAGLPLYGHELDRATSPFEAGLGGFVKLGRGFIGEEALAQQLANGTRKHLIGIRTADAKSIARQGYAISRGGEEVGVITSGTYAPTFKRPLAIGYVAASSGIESEGDEIEIVIRNRRVAAETVALPFYRRSKREGAPS